MENGMSRKDADNLSIRRWRTFLVHRLAGRTRLSRQEKAAIDFVGWLSVETMPERNGGSSIDSVEEVVAFARAIREDEAWAYARLYG